MIFSLSFILSLCVVRVFFRPAYSVHGGISQIITPCSVFAFPLPVLFFVTFPVHYFHAVPCSVTACCRYTRASCFCNYRQSLHYAVFAVGVPAVLQALHGVFAVPVPAYYAVKVPRRAYSLPPCVTPFSGASPAFHALILRLYADNVKVYVVFGIICSHIRHKKRRPPAPSGLFCQKSQE